MDDIRGLYEIHLRSSLEYLLANSEQLVAGCYVEGIRELDIHIRLRPEEEIPSIGVETKMLVTEVSRYERREIQPFSEDAQSNSRC